jgi:predicted lipoprotein with Yx(FWY)xxD motif
MKKKNGQKQIAFYGLPYYILLTHRKMKKKNGQKQIAFYGLPYYILLLY